MASHHHLFFILFLFLSPQIHSISFQINNFNSSNSNIVYHGDAKPQNGSITFNGNLGWATYSQNLTLCDHNNPTNFKTHFSFQIKNNSTIIHTHEFLAFFLAPSLLFNPQLHNNFTGLFNNSTQTQIIHVELFQAFPWINSSDHQKSTLSHVWISYNATAKNLSVIVSWMSSIISHQIDLMEILPQKLKIGFSSSSIENLRIEFWEFSSWSNVDDNQESENSINMNLLAILIAWVGVFVIAIVLIFVISLIRSGREKKKKKDDQQDSVMKLASIYSDLNREEASPPRRFSYRYLAMATDNFSMDRKLGQGGFGAVFEGNLPGANKIVAVKKIFNGSTQGKREYVSEVKIISRMRHENLVQLIGWCHERDDSESFLLVYEFMPNGSLDSRLFGKTAPPLLWPLRYKISLGLASALLYLHEEWEHSVVHKDIKSSNVLLDSNFTAKLGDFGLARLAKHELNSKTPGGLVGTFGYMAPEYISSGRASKESDMFSYGVVLLEIVSGRKCYCDHSGKGLVELVWDAYGRGEVFEEILDEKAVGAEGFVEAKEVECLSVVGLWCAHPDATQRPSIKQVIRVLSFEEPMPNLPLKMPIPTFNHASSLKFFKQTLVFPETTLGFTCNLSTLEEHVNL